MPKQFLDEEGLQIVVDAMKQYADDKLGGGSSLSIESIMSCPRLMLSGGNMVAKSIATNELITLELPGIKFSDNSDYELNYNEDQILDSSMSSSSTTIQLRTGKYLCISVLPIELWLRPDGSLSEVSLGVDINSDNSNTVIHKLAGINRELGVTLSSDGSTNKYVVIYELEYLSNGSFSIPVTIVPAQNDNYTLTARVYYDILLIKVG